MMSMYEEQQQQEKQQRDARRARLRQIASELVTREPFSKFVIARDPGQLADEQTIKLVCIDGRTINLTTDRWGHKGRLYVDGSYPKSERGTFYAPRNAPSITIALDRPIETVRKDIARRFLDEYSAVFLAVKEQFRVAKNRRDVMLDAGRRIAEKLRIRFEEDRMTESVQLTAYTPEYMKVGTYDGEEFKLELTIKSEAVLMAVLDMVAPRKERR